MARPYRRTACVVDVSSDIARESARIHASTRLRAPDALIIATAIVAGADLLVTNDRSWPGRVKLGALDLERRLL